MEPLDYSNRPLGEKTSVNNLKNFDPQIQNTAAVPSCNMNIPNNASKFPMNPMGHVYVQASTLMNSFMLQDGSHTYGTPQMSFAHLSHHFNSIRGQEQGQPQMTQPNPNNFQYPMAQQSTNASPVVTNAGPTISASNENRPNVPDASASRPVPGLQVSTASTTVPFASTTLNHSSVPLNTPTTSNLPLYQERNVQEVASTTNIANSTTTTTSTIGSSGQWSDQSESSDTKLSAQQLRLQRETQEERERRLVAGRERMRLYRARERMLESPDEREKRLAVARERTRLGRALENADQRERRLKKTRERLRMKRQMETQDEREKRLKQHRETKRERYHKMSPDERSMLRRASGQRTRSVSSCSSQSDGDLTASQRGNQRTDDRNASMNNQWNNEIEGFPFGLDVKVEPDDILNRVEPTPSQPASTSSASSLPVTTSTVASTAAPSSTAAGGSTDQPSLRLPPDKAPQTQALPPCGAPLHYPSLPNIVGGASAAHPNFNYEFKPSPAGLLQAIRPLRFPGVMSSPTATTTAAAAAAANHYPNGPPHLALTNYNHRDLCNSLNPL